MAKAGGGKEPEQQALEGSDAGEGVVVVEKSSPREAQTNATSATSDIDGGGDATKGKAKTSEPPSLFQQKPATRKKRGPMRTPVAVSV